MPTEQILKKYADVLIKFALWGGKGLQKGEMVFLMVPESAKAFLIPLQQSVLEAGGYPVIHYGAEGISRSFYENANDDQLAYHPKNYLLGRIQDMDCSVFIISESDPKELQGVDSKKIMKKQKELKFYMEARHKKEDEGKFFWTLGSFGTEAMAKEAGLTLEEYWNQIIKACYLNEEDPISRWREIFRQIDETREKLNKLDIEWLHIEGEDIDLRVKVGKHRTWLGGGGNNIPSFELFISPDWRGTEGWIRFNQPLYRYGTLVKGIELKFRNGLVVESGASENEKVLKDMIATENADKIGEFSLTDIRFSKIDKFMAETLYDENFGGKYGNTHIALGNAYHESYDGDVSLLKDKDWEELGYNTSVVHTDIISTSNRVVTAVMADGSKRVVYRDGMFGV